MPQIQIVRKGYMPFAKMRVEVGPQVFFMKGGNTQQINLPEGEIEVRMYLEGWRGVNRLDVTAQTTRLLIRPLIPDWVYLVGIILISIFFYVDDLEVWAKAVIGAAMLGLIVTVFYFSFIRSKNYFNCSLQ